MRLYFVRHGQSSYNVKKRFNSDPKKKVLLTKLGVKQINKVKSNLKNKKIEVIFVSEFPRTIQTAKIINESHAVPIKIDKRINERRTGFEGKTFHEYIKFIDKNKFHIKPKGGESFQEEKKRVFSFLKDLIKMPCKEVLIVSHEEIMKVIKGYFNKLTDEEMWALSIPNAHLMKFNV